MNSEELDCILLMHTCMKTPGRMITCVLFDDMLSLQITEKMIFEIPRYPMTFECILLCLMVEDDFY